MAHPVIEADECIACGVCVDDCPQGVLELQDVATVTDEDSCIACGVCEGACPVYAGGDAFIGPAALIWASRFVNDSRDTKAMERMDGIDTVFCLAEELSAQLFTLAAIETRLVVHELG